VCFRASHLSQAAVATAKITKYQTVILRQRLPRPRLARLEARREAIADHARHG